MTIKWYLDNRDWWENIIFGDYKDYYVKMYGDREVKNNEGSGNWC